jgi:membrane-associated phospholipid phosphatase
VIEDAAPGQLALRRSAALPIAMLVPVVLMAIFVVVNGDAGVLSFVTTHRRSWLISLAKAVTVTGGVQVLAPLALVAAYVLRRRGTPTLVACAPGVALLCAGAVTAVGKSVIGRHRPPVLLHLVTENEPSMPSGHATDGTAFYVALGMVVIAVCWRTGVARRATAGVLWLLSAAIGMSRLELGVHWPTDVLVSWLLGAIIAVVVVALSVIRCRRHRGGRARTWWETGS